MNARTVLSAIRLVALFTVILGVGYTFAAIGFAHLAFPSTSEGSMVRYQGRVVGSELIGQSFTDPGLFHGRPSATSPAYNAASSAASNLGPSNPKLIAADRQAVRQLLRENPGLTADQIPPAMVESSGSGLDPDIPVAGAMIQVPRIARADHLSERTVRQLVRDHETAPFLGIFGDPCVDVLDLNIALLELRAARGGR